MKEDVAVRYLMIHFMHRMNEFFNDCPAEEIEEKEIGTRFARWLYSKDAAPPKAKVQGGVIAQHFNAEQVTDDEGFVMAHLKLFKEHGVGLLWMADMFVNPAIPLPDALREEIVTVLRFHADRVESHDLDERLKETFKTGTA
jgi:hypothetical protein